MAMAVMAWVVAIPLLGFVTGLRTMTAMAVLCWFAYFGHLPLQGSWAFWAAKPATAVIFSLLAIGEYVADKLPKTPNRIAPGPLVARIVFGGLVGAIIADGLNGPEIEGLILGVAGALIGAYGGYLTRRELVQRMGWKDWPVALAEDAIAVLGAVFAMGIVTG